MNFVFLVYAPRSGSTLLSNLLQRNISGLISLPEVTLLEKIILMGNRKIAELGPVKVKQMLAADAQLTSYQAWASKVNELAVVLCEQGIRDFIANLTKLYGTSQGLEGNVVVVKKGSLLKSLDRVLQEFEGAKVIHICRDPRAVVASMIEATDPYNDGASFSRKDIWYSSRYYAKLFEAKCRFEASGYSICSVSYEDLLIDAERELERAINFLGLAKRHEPGPAISVSISERSLHRRYSKKPDETRIRRWETQLDTRSITLIEILTAKAMEAYGYTPTYAPYLSPWRWMGVILLGLGNFIRNSIAHASRKAFPGRRTKRVDGK